ncbi:LOW QUALITY PROTEIN: ATP_bind_1 domain-containing protein [Cephalotus follicularis]|uniref:GPN-loop GTPase n=1 Tax=Cephalotus follicularis TaxID=3775 RepID=A0A1Q3D275_CEPFO|nr:LOW QUALITY PROTEIN: ATP_bind_1 domain-containing protein [Cephalotus follicularis]
MERLHVEAGSSSVIFKRKPVIIIVVGMAGSGKITFLHRLVCHTASNLQGYVLNLDPAVMTLPYGANIDIRDTVRYKEVMSEFNLGPNGGILTSLNLFATKFDEVISMIERRADQLDYFLVDTPCQIEIFTWSAFGAIITEAFASTFPTVITYVVDTPRLASPVTFMSNMLYACSILYKTRLPLVLAFNKIDVAQHQFALEVHLLPEPLLS